MANAPELTEPQRRLLQLVYEWFDTTLAWPKSIALQRRLASAYQFDLDVDAVTEELAPTHLRIGEGGGREIRLTLEGMRSIYRTNELNDFVCFVRLAVERFQKKDAAEEPTLSTADVAEQCRLDSRRLRKLDLLLAGESWIAWPSQRAPDGGPYIWRVGDTIWKCHGVHSIEDYLKVRAQLIGARPTQETEAGDAPDSPSAAPATPSGPEGILSIRVSDRDLRARCLDILAGRGPYDRVVREASVVLEHRVRLLAGADSNLRGTALMQEAFGLRAPLLRLSDDQSVQQGAMELYRGVMASMRNPAGHSLRTDFSRDDAARFVVMIDLLLGLLPRDSS